MLTHPAPSRRRSPCPGAHNQISVELSVGLPSVALAGNILSPSGKVPSLASVEHPHHRATWQNAHPPPLGKRRPSPRTMRKLFSGPWHDEAYFAASSAAWSLRFSRADCLASHFLRVALAVLWASLWAANCSETDLMVSVAEIVRLGVASLWTVSASFHAWSASSFSVEHFSTACSQSATSSCFALSILSLSAAASASPFSLESSASKASARPSGPPRAARPPSTRRRRPS